jgi:hypothetical protein
VVVLEKVPDPPVWQHDQTKEVERAPEQGKRAAALIEELPTRRVDLPDGRVDLLVWDEDLLTAGPVCADEAEAQGVVAADDEIDRVPQEW